MSEMVRNGVKAFYAKDRKAWRKWLEKNHDKEKSLWLIIYRKQGKTPSVYYAEAVEEALCFGWIDSKPNKRDSESFYLYFSKRNPNSRWSKLNKDRVKKLISEGLMTEPGHEVIRIAKQNKTWSALDKIENLIMPNDLNEQLSKNKQSLKNFLAFPPSAQKGILQWIDSAKRPETRQKRIAETVLLAAKNIRANSYPRTSSE